MTLREWLPTAGEVAALAGTVEDASGNVGDAKKTSASVAPAPAPAPGKDEDTREAEIPAAEAGRKATSEVQKRLSRKYVTNAT